MSCVSHSTAPRTAITVALSDDPRSPVAQRSERQPYKLMTVVRLHPGEFQMFTNFINFETLIKLNWICLNTDDSWIPPMLEPLPDDKIKEYLTKLQSKDNEKHTCDSL